MGKKHANATKSATARIPRRAVKDAPRKEPGTALVPLELRYWVRFFRCAHHHQADRREGLKSFCPNCMLDPHGDDIPVYTGDRFPTFNEMGRPTLYNEQRAEMVVHLIRRGWRIRDFGQAERKLKDDGYTPEECTRIASALPKHFTVREWIARYADFADMVARAQAHAASTVAVEEIYDIADDARNDFVMTERGPAFDNEHVNRSKLRVAVRERMQDRLSQRFQPAKQVNVSVTTPATAQAALVASTDEELEQLLADRRASRGALPKLPERETP